MPIFDQIALPFTLAREGGYVDDPADPGGATNFGITEKVYDAWRTAQGQPTQDVRLISSQEVSAIYLQKYWTLAHCDVMPAAMAVVTFDTAVNSGVEEAIILLQRAVGATADGVWGPMTATMVGKAGPKAFEDYLWLRADLDRGIAAAHPERQKFLPGWIRRIFLLRQTAASLMYTA